MNHAESFSDPPGRVLLPLGRASLTRKELSLLSLCQLTLKEKRSLVRVETKRTRRDEEGKRREQRGYVREEKRRVSSQRERE